MTKEDFKKVENLPIRTEHDGSGLDKGVFISGITQEQVFEVFQTAKRAIEKPQQLSVEEMELVVEYIDAVANGTEHGITTFDQWKISCGLLKSFLESKGYKPKGKWSL